MSSTSVPQSEIVFEAMETLPRYIEAACLEVQRRVVGDAGLQRSLDKARVDLARGEYWMDRHGVLHIESSTTAGKIYCVDVLGYCSCAAYGRCRHQVVREIVVLAGSLASHEAWDYVRAQGGAMIWRTKTGYLACFDGTVVVHVATPADARAALLDYQVGLLEHGLVDMVLPTHEVPVRVVNGMHSAYFAALVDAGLSTTRDVVAEQRARAAQAAVVVLIEKAA